MVATTHILLAQNIPTCFCGFWGGWLATCPLSAIVMLYFIAFVFILLSRDFNTFDVLYDMLVALVAPFVICK